MGNEVGLITQEDIDIMYAELFPSPMGIEVSLIEIWTWFVKRLMRVSVPYGD